MINHHQRQCKHHLDVVWGQQLQLAGAKSLDTPVSINTPLRQKTSRKAIVTVSELLLHARL